MEIASDGLLGGITSYFTSSNQTVGENGQPVIDAPFSFIIEKANGTIVHLQPGKIQFTSHTPSFITWKIINTSEACDVICDGRFEYDGYLNYHLPVKAKKSLSLKDIRMEVGMDKIKPPI